MKTLHQGRWISIDGVEAVGKTTVARDLTHALKAVNVSEFSGTPIGTALRAAVKISPHYISNSPLGQSLVFLGDFIELVHTRITPALKQGKIVVTDRGYLSKYAYQEVVMEAQMSNTEARRLLDVVFGFLPTPAVTVLLTAPSQVLKERLIERGETCDEDRLAFMERAELAARECLNRHPDIRSAVLESNRSISETLQSIRTKLEEFLS